MRKFKIFWDFEAEEKFLHEMALKGFILTKYSIWGFYHFSKEEPKDLNYRIDYKTFKSQMEFDNYVTLFADAGWKLVSGGRYIGTQIFLPMNEEAGTDIFSDNESAALRYKKLYSMCECNFALFIVDWVVIFDCGNDFFQNFGFLTPGLWSMKGREFWCAFLFELPFASLRILLPLFFLIFGILYAYWGCRANKAYKEKMKSKES